VANSPYNINVKEGADHRTSLIENFAFTIRSKTKTGKNLTKGGEPFEVKINGGKHPVNFKDNGDGSYSVNYQLSQKGKYTVEVKVNGQNIQGSPYEHAY